MATTMRATTGINKVTIQVAGGSGPPYVLPPATNATLGGVIVPDGGGLAIDSGGNLTVTPYVLPPATNTTLGGVIIPDGGNLAIDSGGNLTVTGGGNYVPLLDKSGTIIDYFSNTTVFGTANATNAMATGDFIYDDGGGTYTKNTGALWVGSGYEQAFSGVYQPSASSVPYPKMSFFDGGSEVSLELLSVPGGASSVGIEAKIGGSLYYEAQNANCILTRGYADTRYVPIANLTGTAWDGKVFVGGVFGDPTANLVSGVINERGVKQFLTSYRDGANITQIWVDKNVARIYGSPTGNGPDSAEISASREGGIALRTGSNQDATLFKQGTQLWSDYSILTRGYADSRYLQSNGTGYLAPDSTIDGGAF